MLIQEIQYIKKSKKENEKEMRRKLGAKLESYITRRDQFPASRESKD